MCESERTGESAQLDVLVCVADDGEVALKVGAGDDDGAAAVVGMEGEGGGLKEAGVEEEVDVVLRVVDKAEGGDAARLKAEVLHHTLGGGEGKFAAGGETLGGELGLEALLKVVDGEVVVAMEADEIVLVALVIAEEEILAMHGTVIVPPTLGFLYGLTFGMGVVGEGYGVTFKEREDSGPPPTPP